MQAEIFAGFFGRGAVAAEVGDRAWIRAILDFEAALAGALADVGLASRAVAEEIVVACREAEIDPTVLGAGTAKSGTPVPALLAALRARLSAQAAVELHRGATSQDALDSAAMLVAKRALKPLLADLDGAATAAAALAERHRAAVQPGRTLLQQALPVTFGLKAAGWLASLDAAAIRLDEVRRHDLAAQLGGAAGTLAGLGADGLAVAAALSRRLDLADPGLPWHSDRMRPAMLAGALGAASGVAGKIGTDIALLAQTEVGEVSEAGGGGDSSTLPHKRNPVAAIAAVACARRTPGLVATLLAAMPGEHERAAGSWQAEAEVLSDLLRLSGSGAAGIRSSLEGLDVDPERMRANLDLSDGLVMAEALATALAGAGQLAAQDLVKDASARARERGVSLAAAAADTPAIVAALGEQGIAAALDPAGYLGSADELIDRALVAHRKRLGRR